MTETVLPPARRVPPVGYGGPERLFGITGLGTEGPHGVGTLRLDRRHAGGAGAALAVLVDDALGYAAVAAGPEGEWSVSTDITLDLLAPLRPESTVTARARALHVDATLSVTECHVVDDAGRVVALATQRGRFTPIGPEGLDATAAAEDEIAAATRLGAASGLAALIGARRGDGPGGASATRLTVGRELGNRFGALHGGVALAASLLEAEAVLREAGRDALAPTSIRITYPRPIEGGAEVRFRGAMLHSGRSFAVLDVAGEVAGRLATSAQVTAHPLG